MTEAPEQDDPEVVRREYADERALAARCAMWGRRTGPQPQDVAFDEVLALRPRRVLDAGCGRGEFAERLAREGIDVVAVDQSERMVELTRKRGVDARVADVQDLPFEDAEFDVAAANFMLYHVPDVHRALAELARVAPTLVAATNGVGQLAELWELAGRDLSDRRRLFMRETGHEMLRPHFASVHVVGLDGTIEITHDEMQDYLAHSVAHKKAAVPAFEGVRAVTTSSAVFVAS